jgi:tetratricopeptide (TPR) repeat protein
MNLRRRWALAAVVLAMTCIAAPGAAQSRAADPPPLSQPVLDALPAAVRSNLQHAYDKTRARPRDASAAGGLAMLLHAYEQYRMASLYYASASRLDPNSIAWAYLAGVVLAELGENDQAVSSFRRALALDASHLPARMRLADALMARGDLGASRAEYEELVSRFPELAVAHYGLGRVLAALGDLPGAVNRYQHALDLAPQFGRAHYALALAYRDADTSDRAERHLKAYRLLGPRRPRIADPLLDEVRSMTGTARELIAQAARLGSVGQLHEAIALHLKALEADPSAAQAHVNLISLYGRIGRSDKAEQHYRAALHLKSDLAEAHYNYGVLQAAAGSDAAAAEAFRRALDADPFHAQAHNNLGALLAQQGRQEEAAEQYRQALASDPQHRIARFGLGRLLVALGRPREAIEQFQKILVPEGPDTPRYRYALANAWFAAGDRTRAIQHAEEASRHARRLGQPELAAKIEQELHRMKAMGR